MVVADPGWMAHPGAGPPAADEPSGRPTAQAGIERSVSSMPRAGVAGGHDPAALWFFMDRGGLRLFALNVDGEAAVPVEIPKFITETRLSLPILLDTDAKLSEELLKVKMMPTLLMIDRKGRVRHVHEGFESTSLNEVVAHLELLLNEP